VNISLSEALSLAEKAAPLLSLVLVPALKRFLEVGRRAKVASLVAQLASEVLRSVARRKGVHAAEAAHMAEAIEELERRLIAVGVDPKKVADIAERALSGAHSPEEAAQRGSRAVLEGKSQEGGDGDKQD
jgi:hypothetical protein